MAVSQPRSVFSRAAGWVATHLAASVFALVAALLYALLRVSYRTFYARFDVQPEDVGLGQTEILTQTGLFLLVYVLFWSGYMVLSYVIFRAMGLRPYRDPRDAPLWRRAWAFMSSPYWFVFVAPVVILASTLFYYLPDRARALADGVEKGETVRPPSSLSLRLVDLSVEALPARLTSLGENDLPAELRSRSLRYLGEAGGILILYDWKTKRTIRLPAGSMVVTTHG
jgi:hypothetical protein